MKQKAERIVKARNTITKRLLDQIISRDTHNGYAEINKKNEFGLSQEEAEKVANDIANDFKRQGYTVHCMAKFSKGYKDFARLTVSLMKY